MNLKSRKLLCAATCFAAATAAMLGGIADFNGWADFTKWIFGLYAAGNVGEHNSRARGRARDAAAPIAPIGASKRVSNTPKGFPKGSRGFHGGAPSHTPLRANPS